jgi:hypothetical protein
MPISLCRVSHIDLGEVNHPLRSKRSRSKPVALAAAEFRQGEIITDTPSAMAEFYVTLLRRGCRWQSFFLKVGQQFSEFPQHANTRKAAESLAPSLSKAANLIR